MKRFLIKVLTYIIGIFTICYVAAVSIDPYNVYHWENIRDNGIEPNKNYIKTKYLISYPEKYDAIVLGSSRVGALHVENIESCNVFNMTYSQGVPAEHFDTIAELVKNGVNIRRIYMGVDSISYTRNPEGHKGNEIHASFKELKNPITFNMLYLNPSVNFSSIEVSRRNSSHMEGLDTFYTAGWDFDYNHETSFNWDTATPSLGTDYIMDKTLEDISKIVSFCSENNIELIVFTNPMVGITYEASLEIGYMEFLDRLASITPFYNFSGMNDITRNTVNFIDSSHYTAEVGDKIIDVIEKDTVDPNLHKDGFGWYVTSDNVDELISIIE